MCICTHVGMCVNICVQASVCDVCVDSRVEICAGMCTRPVCRPGCSVTDGKFQYNRDTLSTTNCSAALQGCVCKMPFLHSKYSGVD